METQKEKELDDDDDDDDAKFFEQTVVDDSSIKPRDKKQMGKKNSVAVIINLVTNHLLESFFNATQMVTIEDEKEQQRLKIEPFRGVAEMEAKGNKGAVESKLEHGVELEKS